MIEFQHFKACPHAGESLQNLREIMSEMSIDENELQIVDVPDQNYAQKVNFQGSPSILVNGIDLYTGVKPRGFSYACRIYEIGGRQTGVIPKAFIRERLESYRLEGRANFSL